MDGLFRIVAERGGSYELQLPPSYKMHPVFHPDRLRKAKIDPLIGQELTEVAPEIVNGQPE